MKVPVLNDSRSAIALLTNDNAPHLLARRVAKTFLDTEYTGGLFFLQRLPSYVSVAGKNLADALASSAHPQETPKSLLKRFVEVRRLIKAIGTL